MDVSQVVSPDDFRRMCVALDDGIERLAEVKTLVEAIPIVKEALDAEEDHRGGSGIPATAGTGGH